MYLTEPLLREFIGDDILLTKTEEAPLRPRWQRGRSPTRM